MAVPFNDNIRYSNPKPSDDRYFQRQNGLTPWASPQDVNNNIPIHHRHIGLTVNIMGVEWWYKVGVGDNDLIRKQIGSGDVGLPPKRDIILIDYVADTDNVLRIKYEYFIEDDNIYMEQRFAYNSDGVIVATEIKDEIDNSFVRITYNYDNTTGRLIPPVYDRTINDFTITVD